MRQRVTVTNVKHWASGTTSISFDGFGVSIPALVPVAEGDEILIKTSDGEKMSVMSKIVGLYATSGQILWEA